MYMKENSENQILTADLRETLKGIMKKELENLPETLNSLEPRVRIETVIKLMQFVLPKIETIQPTAGEPYEWGL